MYEYRAKVARVIDGDTLDLIVDLGFKVDVRVRVRLYGIDTPETFGVKKGSAEHAAGKAAAHFVHDWLLGRDVDGRAHALVIKSHDGKSIGVGKYGRWIVDIHRWLNNLGKPTRDPVSLSAALLAADHARAVDYS